MRFVRWLFAGAFRAERDAGYREAIEQILLLPEKVRLGNTLGLDGTATIKDCSFVGGNPAIRVTTTPKDAPVVLHNLHFREPEVAVRFDNNEAK